MGTNIAISMFLHSFAGLVSSTAVHSAINLIFSHDYKILSMAKEMEAL